MKNVIIFGFLLLIFGCIPIDKNKPSTNSELDFTDINLQNLYDIGDRGNTDSLLLFLGDENPNIRILTATLLGNIKDPKAIAGLGKLLEDPIVSVRERAAFSLGQIGDLAGEPYLVKAFVADDSTNTHQNLNAIILESIGKCGSEKSLSLMSKITTYEPSQVDLNRGLIYGLYRFGLRNMISPASTKKVLDYIEDTRQDPSVRRVAAYYLQRVKNINLDSASTILITAFEREKDPETKAALAIPLGKTMKKVSLWTLQKQMALENDWRVKCQIVKAFAFFELKEVYQNVETALRNSNPHIAKTAGQFCIDHGNIITAGRCWSMAVDTINPYPGYMKGLLFSEANKWIPNTNIKSKTFLNDAIKSAYLREPNTENKASLLRALGFYPVNYLFLQNEATNSNNAVIANSALEALKSIPESPDLPFLFGAGYLNAKKSMFDFTLKMLKSGDPAKIVFASENIRNEKTGFKNILGDSVQLDQILNNIKIPQNIEAYRALQETMATLANKLPYKPSRIKHNHPIDWKIFLAASDTTKFRVKTTKGDFIIVLYKQMAPGTVTNFIDLIQKQFYRKKTFHRVVPNFVIQGGCTKGDGYGSLDYTIRSEFSPIHWDSEGLIGMASVGNHTECQQFFITHSATPHLDGNYTIFGRVIDGMNVVNSIQEGDQIESIEPE